jgi:hypothetical protein
MNQRKPATGAEPATTRLPDMRIGYLMHSQEPAAVAARETLDQIVPAIKQSAREVSTELTEARGYGGLRVLGLSPGEHRAAEALMEALAWGDGSMFMAVAMEDPQIVLRLRRGPEALIEIREVIAEAAARWFVDFDELDGLAIVEQAVRRLLLVRSVLAETFAVLQKWQEDPTTRLVVRGVSPREARRRAGEQAASAGEVFRFLLAEREPRGSLRDEARYGALENSRKRARRASTKILGAVAE